MKRVHFVCLVTLGVLNISSGLALDFAEQPFFKTVTGHWVGEGEFVPKEGATVKVREVWEGKANQDGTFSISGKRERGEEKQEFTWSFTHNPATDLYECEYVQSGMEKPMRFDVTATDKRAVLLAPLGDSGGEVVITFALMGKTMEGEVIFKSSEGAELLKGKLIHKRSKKE